MDMALVIIVLGTVLVIAVVMGIVLDTVVVILLLCLSLQILEGYHWELHQNSILMVNLLA